MFHGNSSISDQVCASPCSLQLHRWTTCKVAGKRQAAPQCEVVHSVIVEGREEQRRFVKNLGHLWTGSHEAVLKSRKANQGADTRGSGAHKRDMP